MSDNLIQKLKEEIDALDALGTQKSGQRNLLIRKRTERYLARFGLVLGQEITVNEELYNWFFSDIPISHKSKYSNRFSIGSKVQLITPVHRADNTVWLHAGWGKPFPVEMVKQAAKEQKQGEVE